MWSRQLGGGRAVKMLMREIKADDTRSLLAIIYAFDARRGQTASCYFLAFGFWPWASAKLQGNVRGRLNYVYEMKGGSLAYLSPLSFREVETPRGRDCEGC